MAQHQDVMPAPAEIRAARESAGLTQTAAGVAVYATLRTWQDWESGRRAINPAAWRVFLHRTGQRPIDVDLTQPRPRFRPQPYPRRTDAG